MMLSNRTHFYLTGKSPTSWIAYENMFTLVVKFVRSRIVADFTDSYDLCETGCNICDIYSTKCVDEI